MKKIYKFIILHFFLFSFFSCVGYNTLFFYPDEQDIIHSFRDWEKLDDTYFLSPYSNVIHLSWASREPGVSCWCVPSTALQDGAPNTRKNIKQSPFLVLACSAWIAILLQPNDGCRLFVECNCKVSSVILEQVCGHS